MRSPTRPAIPDGIPLTKTATPVRERPLHRTGGRRVEVRRLLVLARCLVGLATALLLLAAFVLLALLRIAIGLRIVRLGLVALLGFLLFWSIILVLGYAAGIIRVALNQVLKDITVSSFAPVRARREPSDCAGPSGAVAGVTGSGTPPARPARRSGGSVATSERQRATARPQAPVAQRRNSAEDEPTEVGSKNWNSVERAGDRCPAGLVAEQLASGIGSGRPADQRPPEQVRLARPPPPVLRPRLVDPETGKGDEIDRDQV